MAFKDVLLLGGFLRTCFLLIEERIRAHSKISNRMKSHRDTSKLPSSPPRPPVSLLSSSRYYHFFFLVYPSRSNLRIQACVCVCVCSSFGTQMEIVRKFPKNYSPSGA